MRPKPMVLPQKDHKFWLRFWKRVHPEPNTGCWLWEGTIIQSGYGQCVVSGTGKMHYVHRISYVWAKGEIPDGLTLDHLCRNRACCNPDHLEAVTYRENAIRGTSFVAVNAKKTQCPRGHPYTEDSVMWLKNPRRKQCRICHNTRTLARYHAA